MSKLTKSLAIAVCLVQSASAGIAFQTQNDDTAVYTFGSPVESGENARANIGSESSVNANRFAFRSGTVNVKSGGYIRVNGYDAGGENPDYGNWVGANWNAATLNIDGGTFWVDIGGASNNGAGVLRIGVNGGVNDVTVNLNSGVLRVDKHLHVGATLYKSTNACAKNVVVNVSGGTAQIATLNLGTSSSAAGASEGGGYADATLNLTGGTLEVAKFNFNAYHNQYFTWGGGTIKATAADIFSSTALLAGCTRTVNVTGNPAVFNTGNYAQTIPADIASGSGTLKLTGGNTVTLSAVPSFGLWLDGTTLAFASGLGSSVTVPSIALGSGSAIVFDSDSMGQEASLTATGGFSLPDGGSVLDFVQVVGTDAALCVTRLSADGKTISVMKTSSSDYIWNGGAAGNWGDAYAWTSGNVAATWADGKNAIFLTANAMVTLAADASADSAMFMEDTTIATGGGTLTVPSVSVANGVSATIVAPISGAFEKVGAGTLVVSNRTDATTTLSEGTLAICNGASLDWSKLTLGTDAAKPVTLDLAPNATLTTVPAPFYIGTVPNITATVRKAGGDWSVNGTFAIGRGANGAVTTFLHEGGTLTGSGYIVVGAANARKSTMVVSGGTVSSSLSTMEALVLIGTATDASVIVTNNGTLSANSPFSIAQYGAGSLDVADGGTVTARGLYIGGTGASSPGTVNLSSGGTIELSGSVSNMWYNKTGQGTFNFNGGTLKAGAACALIASHDKLDVNVLANGGVIDNGGYAIAINNGIVGVGGITLKGAGTTTFSVNQDYVGATTVKSGTTLSAIGRTFAGPVVFESGADVVAPVVPEGESSVEVMTAASFTGVELLPKVGAKQFFVKGNRLMFGNKPGFVLIVK